MQRILIKYKDNWADEFDISGFRVTTKEDWDEHMAEVKKYFKNDGSPIERYFGTNEYIEFDSFNTYKKNYKIQNITDDDFVVLLKIFGDKKDDHFEYGDFLTLEGYIEPHDGCCDDCDHDEDCCCN